MRSIGSMRAVLPCLIAVVTLSATAAEAAYQLFDTLSNRLVRAEVIRQDLAAAPTNAPSLFLRPNTSGSEFLWIVQNLGIAPMEIALPRYLIVSFPTRNCPGAPCSTNEYLAFLPGPSAVSLGLHEAATNRIAHIFFLGQPDPRPSSVTDAPLGAVKPIAPGTGLARLSDELLKTNPPNSNRIGQVLFYITAGTLSGQKLEDVLMNMRYAQVRQMKPVLTAIGLDPTSSLPFEAADRRYESILAALRSGLTSPELAATTMVNLPVRFLEGDREIARALVPYLAQPGDELHRGMVISTLEKLGVQDKVVLDVLFRCSLTDPVESSRMDAALAGARLGDVRSIPILMQYLGNVTDSNREVAQIKSECLAEIENWRTRGQTWIGTMKIEDLRRGEFLSGTPFQSVSPQDLATLKAHLLANPNFHPAPFDLACEDAIDGLSASSREDALRRLAQTIVHQSNPRVIEVLIDRLRNDPEVSVRRLAARELSAQRDPRVAPALADSLKVETDSPLKKEIWDFLRRRREQNLDAN